MTLHKNETRARIADIETALSAITSNDYDTACDISDVSNMVRDLKNDLALYVRADEPRTVPNATVYASLLREIDTEVTMYRSDLIVDMNIIQCALDADPTTRFVHMARDSGTHMVNLPSTLGELDEIVPYLFGSKSNRDIAMECHTIIEHSINDKATFRYWDGSKWRTVAREHAVRIAKHLTEEAIERSEKPATREGV